MSFLHCRIFDARSFFFCGFFGLCERKWKRYVNHNNQLMQFENIPLACSALDLVPSPAVTTELKKVSFLTISRKFEDHGN